MNQNTAQIQEFTQEELELTHFEDSENLFDWQKEIYTELFEIDPLTDKPRVKKANTRKILLIVDRDGKKGKSTFLKWLAVKHPDDCLK